MMTYIMNGCRIVIEVCGIYVFWMVVHFLSANLYAQYCTHFSTTGAFMSLLQVSSPHCIAFRWGISTGGNVITQMWCILGVWISGKIFKNFFENNA